MSFADLTQQVFYRHLAILKIQLNSRRALDTHFVLFGALGKTFETSFHDKCGELVSVDLGEYGIDIRKAAVGDPAFLAIQQIVLSIG